MMLPPKVPGMAKDQATVTPAGLKAVMLRKLYVGVALTGSCPINPVDPSTEDSPDDNTVVASVWPPPTTCPNPELLPLKVVTMKPQK